MLKKIFGAFVISVFVIAIAGLALAQEPKNVPQPQINEQIIRGEVKEIAEDGAYIIVDKTNILTDKEILDESYLELGDRIEVTAEQTPEGLKLIDFYYISDEEAGLEEGMPEEEVPAEENMMPEEPPMEEGY